LVKRGGRRFSGVCQFNFETLNKRVKGFVLIYKEMWIIIAIRMFILEA